MSGDKRSEFEDDDTESASTSTSGHRPEVVPGSSKMDQTCEPPNRRQFERALSRLTADINAKEQQLKFLLGHGQPANSSSSTAYVPGEISRLREESKRCRRSREHYRQEFANYQRRSDDLKKLLADKRQEIYNVEGNLLSRNEQRLAEQLKRYQSLYDEGKFTNIREEQAIVQHIDKLQRNQKYLKKWKVLCEERDSMDGELKTTRTQIQECYRKIKESKRNEEGHKETLRQSAQSGAAMKKELNNLFSQKRHLIQDYNEKKQSYVEWRRVHPGLAPVAQSDRSFASLGGRRQSFPLKLKRKVSGTSSSGSFTGKAFARHGAEDSDSDSDGGVDFELFVEEKRTCKNLISYLQKVIPPPVVALGLTLSTGSGDSENLSSGSTNHATLSNASSSAEEQQILLDAAVQDSGECLAVLRKSDEVGSASLLAAGPSEGNVRRKASKKDKLRKAHQSISYDPHTLSLFDSVAIPAPLTISEVSAVIETLKEKLKYFEDQTRMPPDTSSASYWFTTYGVLSTTDRLISSESEMTTDSARFSYVTPSDLDDSLSTTGLLSPDYGSIATGSTPPTLTFATRGGSMDHDDATTPLAAKPLDSFPIFQSKIPEKLSPVEEAGGEKLPDQDTGHLSRVPTYDEGFADLMTEGASKDSSAGDSAVEISVAKEILQKLGNVRLDGVGSTD